MENETKLITSVVELEEAIARVREAQRKFATYTQEQVDRIFLAAASAANREGTLDEEGSGRVWACYL